MRYILLALALSSCVSEERMRVLTNHYGSVHRQEFLNGTCRCHPTTVCPPRRNYR
jgi:hypothetical protein